MKIRHAVWEDSDRIFKIRNHPDVLPYTGGDVEAEVHARWYRQELQDRNAAILVVVDEHGIVQGYARFDASGRVSIAVDPAFRGRGFARTLLSSLEEEAIARHLPQLIAEVHPENVTSANLFQSCGYEPRYVLEL